MRRQTRYALTTVAVLAAAVTVPAGIAAAGPPAPPVTSAAEPVIVMMRQQLGSMPTSHAAIAERVRVARGAQAGLLRRAKVLGGTRIKQFTTVNALSMSLSTSAIASLQADPDVAAVVPDLTVHSPKPRLAGADSPASIAAGSGAGSLAAKACAGPGGGVSLEPEALQTMRVDYGDGRDSASNYTDGAGVKVAYIADGIDVDNPDFMRDGKSIFIDYKDFSGTGPVSPGDGFESFGDASAIAAQGNKVYDVNSFVNPAHTIPGGCKIRIRGVAPGVSLVGLKDSASGSTPTSVIVQAIDYAVTVDHVDVLNESIGGDPYPDTAIDPLRLADAAATAAGVTVVVATGDAGTSNTVESPASSPDVIAVGATTTFRTFAQTGEGTTLPGITGWADDNISGLSSSGFTQSGRVLDVVAPGDTGWSVCTADPVHYQACQNDKLQPSSIHEFGGTSQGAPLVSGVAALVIGAYEKAHPHAGRPAPALVKAIITSTARNLGHPAQLQGSGEVDALAAVKAAIAIPGGPTTTGSSDALLARTSQLDLVGTVGHPVTGSVAVTNLSARAQRITASATTLGPAGTIASGHLDFDSAALPTFTFAYGDTRAYTKVGFTVPAGQARVSATYAYSGAQNGATRIQSILVDPHGVMQTFSSTQGAADFNRSEARYPAPGRWTLYLFSILPQHTTVNYRITTATYVAAGTVTPASQVVAPGHSATVRFTQTLGSRPIDTADALSVHASGGATLTIPVALVPELAVGSRPGSFTDTVTGGDGREGEQAQTNTYDLDVPAGLAALSASIRFTDPGSAAGIYYGYLVSPSGQALTERSNVGNYRGTVHYAALQLSVRSPAAGHWRLILDTSNPDVNNLLSRAFTATITSHPTSTVVSRDVPTSAKVVLPVNRVVTAHVQVTNRGATPEYYFLDPRNTDSAWYRLLPDSDDDINHEPLNDPQFYEAWLVPDHTDLLAFGASAAYPLRIDANFGGGDPEILGAAGTTSTVSISDTDQVAPGVWFSQAQLVGPFAKPAPHGTAQYAGDAHTLVFDNDIRTSTGDYWQDELTPLTTTTNVAPTARPDSFAHPEPVLVAPGHTATISVHINPDSSRAGQLVNGTLFLDSLDYWTGDANQISALPYSYTTQG